MFGSSSLEIFRAAIDSGEPEAIAGRPVYLALCMNEAGVLRFKPQNLLVNLPLADRS